ncbi:MAG: ATP synthase F1 subunit gamma [Candidatus Paceibacteria bacterium]
MALKDIKGKIASVKRTRQVTRAMEAVSAVKMRKSQVRALTNRPYAHAALSILSRLAPSLEQVAHPLTEKRPERNAALVVITSDKGLAGVLNSAVLKEAKRRITDLKVPKDGIHVYAFGRKACEHFARQGFDVVERRENVSDDVSVSDLAALSHAVVGGFMDGTYDRADIVYTSFRSTFEQEAVSRRVLPLSMGAIGDIVAGITPEKGVFSDEREAAPPSFYTAEPAPEEVLDTLLPRLVNVVFFHALLESKASEHSARMIAMKNASDKSEELTRSLTRTFNKVRQAMITREVSEIVGGIEAMATD